MAERVAEIEVYAGLQDRDLIAGLRRVEAEFDRTVRKLSSEEAEAKLDADIRPLKAKIKEAEADLKKFEKRQADADLTKGQQQYAKQRSAALKDELEGLRKTEAAEARKLDLLKKENVESDRAAKMQAAEAKRVDAIGKLQDTQAKRNAKASADQAAADAKNEAARVKAQRDMAVAEERAYALDQRRTEQKTRDADRLSASSDRAAAQRVKNEEKVAYASSVGAAKERAQIVQMQRQYAKLTDQAERVGRRKAFTVEGRAKLDLDDAGIRSKMELLKAQLNFLGAHPPVDIQVDIDKRASMGRIKRGMASMGDMVRSVAEKGANLSDLTLRMGPFTGTLKQFGIALAFLGPTITDVAGAAGSLVGVLSGGVVGAASVATAGIIGLGAGFLGLKFATRNTGQEIAQARKSIDALQAAQLKYGKGSDQAKKKQAELNSVLKQISPLSKESALGIEAFYSQWDKLTGKTQKNLGSMAKGAFSALKAITPMWAKSTNDLSTTMDKSLKGAFKFLKSPEFKSDFESITGNFNKTVPSLMHALGSVGRAFLNFGKEGSKYLQPLGTSIDKVAGKLLAFTQRDDFGATVKRWVGYARDITNLFGAAGKVLTHFFSAGAQSGDRLVNTMTKALNRWDEFLTSAGGKNEISDGFDRAVDGAQALWAAIAPIAGAFVAWSSNFSPFVTGLLQGVGYVSKLAAALTKILGLGGPLAALGTALGAMWAIGKIGAFVSMLARIPAILREIKATSGAMGLLTSVGNGSLIKSVRSGGTESAQIASGGSAAGAEMRAGIVAGGSAAAAEMRAAVASGGAVGGAASKLETAAASRTPGGVILPAGAGAAVEAEKGAVGLSKLARAGNAAKAGLAGLGALTVGVGSATAGIGVIAVAAAAGLALYSNRTRVYQQAEKDAIKSTQAYRTVLAGLPGQNYDLANSVLAHQQSELDLTTTLKQSKGEIKDISTLEKQRTALVKDGKKGSQEYKDVLQQQNAVELQHKQTLLQIRQARLNERAAQEQTINLNRIEQKSAQALVTTTQASLKQRKKQLSDLGSNNVDLGTLASINAGIKGGGAGSIADIYKQVSQKAAEAGKSVKQFMKDANFESSAQKKLNEYADAWDATGRASARANTALAAANLQAINNQRALAGLAPIANNAARALQTVSKLGGKNLSTKISLKYDDPSKAANVAKSAASALKSGVPTKIVTKIIADSSSATSAIRSLNRAKLEPKTLKILQQGGDGAKKILDEILGKKLGDKAFKILAGDGDAKSKIQALIALGIPPKTAKILGNNDDARAKAAQANAQKLKPLFQSILRTVGALPAAATTNPAPLHQTIFQYVSKVSKGGADGGLFSFASGGSTMSGPAARPNENQIDRARTTATMSGKRRTRGGKYSQPTLLVGEENQSEFVIATNPKYRKKNKKYVQAAASALGMKKDDFEKGAQKKANEENDKTNAQRSAAGGAYGSAYKGNGPPVSGKPYQASADLGNAPSAQILKTPKKHPAKFTKTFKKHITQSSKTAYGYVNYIQGLQTAQEDWEKTYDQRQSAVQEPDDFVKEDGRIKAPDGTDLGPKIVVDQDAIDSYIAALQPVRDAAQQVVNIVTQLIAEIPKALSAIQAAVDFRSMEISMRGSNMNALDGDIDKDKKIISNHKSGKTQDDKDKVKYYTNKLKDDQGHYDAQKKLRDIAKQDKSDLLDDKKTMNDSFRTAGFDLVDAQQNLASVNADIAGVQGKASADADTQNAGTTAGGGGTTTVTTPPEVTTTIGIAEQTALALQQNAQTLSAFGSNFIGGGSASQFAAGAIAGAGAGTGGQQGNPVGLGSLVGGGSGSPDVVAGSAGATAAVSSAGAAVGSSNAAATFMTDSGKGSSGGSSGSSSAPSVMPAAGGVDSAGPSVTINNTFANVPPDPHTWSKGVEFELGSTL